MGQLAKVEGVHDATDSVTVTAEVTGSCRVDVATPLSGAYECEGLSATGQTLDEQEALDVERSGEHRVSGSSSCLSLL